MRYVRYGWQGADHIPVPGRRRTRSQLKDLSKNLFEKNYCRVPSQRGYGVASTTSGGAFVHGARLYPPACSPSESHSARLLHPPKRNSFSLSYFFRPGPFPIRLGALVTGTQLVSRDTVLRRTCPEELAAWKQEYKINRVWTRVPCCGLALLRHQFPNFPIFRTNCSINRPGHRPPLPIRLGNTRCSTRAGFNWS